VRAARMNA